MSHIRISDIKINPANPRVIKDERFYKLVRSIAHFPAMLSKRGIVVDKNRMSLGGNQRKRGIEHILTMPDSDFQKLMEPRQDLIPFWDGLRQKKSIPENWVVDGSDFTEDEIRRFVIADNISFGELDMDALANEWDEKELEEWGLDLPGFAGKQEAEDDDYEMPDEIQTDIVLGDLFEIGNHRLLCGDSTKKEDVEKLMNGAIADLVFTDPDFSMDFDLVRECYKNSKLFSKGIAFWVCADKQSVQLASNDFDNFSKFFVQDFRQATLVANNQPMTRHVMICQFGKRPMNNLHDGFSTLLQIATDRTSEAHKVTPMSKKPELAFEFIGHYTEENEIVLDLFCHSGSTLIAAHQLKRKMYGMEIEPKYCQCVIDRISEFDPSLEIKKNGITFVNALV